MPIHTPPLMQPEDLWSYLTVDLSLPNLFLQPASESTYFATALAPAPAPGSFSSLHPPPLSPPDTTMGGIFKNIVPATYQTPRINSPRARMMRARTPLISTLPKASSLAKERIRQNIQKRLHDRMAREAQAAETRKRILEEEERASEIAFNDYASGRGRKSRFDRDLEEPGKVSKSRKLAPNLSMMMVPVPFEEVYLDYEQLGLINQDQPRATFQSSLTSQFDQLQFTSPQVSSPATSMGSNHTIIDEMVLPREELIHRQFIDRFQTEHFSGTDFDQYFIAPTVDNSIDDIFAGL